MWAVRQFSRETKQTTSSSTICRFFFCSCVNPGSSNTTFAFSSLSKILKNLKKGQGGRGKGRGERGGGGGKRAERGKEGEGKREYGGGAKEG